ncbi:hypothetical protein TWF730_001312 [Orbilia blumenaviensis]|uniref:F-box domain-containing protein n=1 Tax=Orbilia blumenaviensis TaxID=1796055 RepID=A0AAV9UNK0_9PEZI
MSFDQLPPEILLCTVRDHGLTKADIFHLILTSKYLRQTLRPLLFRQLSYGYLHRSHRNDRLSRLDLHGFGLPDRMIASIDTDYDSDPNHLLLKSLQNGWIQQGDLEHVRELCLYSDIDYLGTNTSIIKLLQQLQGKLNSLAFVSLYLLQGPDLPTIFEDSQERIDHIFQLLETLTTSKVRFELVTDVLHCLELTSKSRILVLDTLFVDATFSPRHLIEQWQEDIKQFTSLTHLAYKRMSPWAATSSQDIEDHHLCDDFPNLRTIRLICSPDFRALPRSVRELYIDIGETDQITHHCFPLITTLPHLEVLFALNRQNRLPRYHGNPLQTARLPGTATNSLRKIHAEMPRCDEKLMFFPPGVVETIAGCNPKLENIFLPFLSAYDISKLMHCECTKTLRTLEIQSSICRTIMRESSFEVSHLIQLFAGPGLPNLEILKWAIGGKPEMAVNQELITALFPDDPGAQRRHNLQLLAVESRLPPPQSLFVLSGLVNWKELLEHRRILLRACYRQPRHGPTLKELIKPVRLILEGLDEEKVDPETEFPYECPKPVVVDHTRLSKKERGYLRQWRKSGGAIGVTEEGENEGLVFDFRKSVFEELYFFDLQRMKSLSMEKMKNI